MGWIISQALYEKWHCSQEQVVEYSEDTCSDGKQSAPLSGNPTQLAYLSPDKMTKFSRLSRFGMTFKPLTESRGEDLLMWYREDFLAKTYPVQEEAQELTENDPACGAKWHELSAKYDLDSCSWRTHQCLWDEELPWSSVTLPRWGMTVSGVLFQHPTAERPISETGSGYWPTPRSCSAMAATITEENSWAENRFPNLETIVGRNMWPTPTAHNAKEAAYPAEFLRKTPTLAASVAMRKFPTPQASDNRDRGNLGSSAIQRRREKGKQMMLSQSVSDISGALNPPWVEWLMGWPLGWTDLKPLAMDKFLVWQQQHSEY